MGLAPLILPSLTRTKCIAIDLLVSIKGAFALSCVPVFLSVPFSGPRVLLYLWFGVLILFTAGILFALLKVGIIVGLITPNVD